MLLVDQACSETSLSMCKHISKRICTSSSRGFVANGFKIASPTTIVLLMIAMMCTTKMLEHVKALCSSVGRKEMITFFYLYLGSTAVETVVVGFKTTISKPSHLFLATIQLTLHSSAFFSLFIGSITTDMFMGAFGLRAITLLKASTAIYFAGIGTMTFVGLSTGNAQLVAVPFFLLNTIFYILYFIFQLKRLRKNNGEIWAYGTLSISLLCFIISNIIVFIGSRLVALLTDRYFDNLFFYHLFVLCTFIMIHKYWLSVYDYEVESLQLEV